jgi:DNA-binding transcriptional ArsR family regulator
MTYGMALAALADPTRRGLFERLRTRSHTVGELAKLAKVTQPAVSQHLKVLREARLVEVEAEGTRRHYRAGGEGLEELRRWIESMWDDVLAAYAGSEPAPSLASGRKARRRSR